MNTTQQLILANEHNNTALREIMTAGWVPSPSTRGTWDIVLSCVVTLFACAYSVLHINIPMDPNISAIFMTKVRWVVLAILFPDTIVVMAYAQYSKARKLQKQLRKLREDLPDLAIKPGPSFDDGINIPDSIPLTTRGFLKFIELDGLCELSCVRKSHFRERSKARVVEKVLVFLQVSWMAAQCIFRLRKNFPITLLEVHTLVHVFFSFILLLLWLKKPMDISHPELLECRSTKMKNFVAFIVQAELCQNASAKSKLVCYAPWSRTHEVLPSPEPSSPEQLSPGQLSTEQPSTLNSREDQHVQPGADDDVDQPVEHVVIQITDKDSGSHDSPQPLLPLASHDLPQPSQRVQPACDDGIILYEGDGLPCGLGLASHDEASDTSRNVVTTQLSLSREDLARLERVADHVYSLPAPAEPRIRRLVNFLPADDSPRCLSDGGNALFQASERRGHGVLTRFFWLLSGVSPSSAYKKVGTGKKKTSAAVVATLIVNVYGVLHRQTADRAGQYPSSIEAQLWYCAIIVCSVASMVNLGMRWMIERRILEPVFVLVAVASFFSRLYLTGESFISLRSLPIGVFVKAEWPSLIPHV
ncbi:hypothetical protein CPLU01_13711 [Colletotrichum plurivorum]|uniref:Uncharacterized protein n=1 Tax=Colletotrichum plurivorum TaxID=2175906 RepID=A0A8H6JQT6_9PEZI|nr:hypothetical protein CPLU01_13711 [Colletotrichum plurivorum]